MGEDESKRMGWQKLVGHCAAYTEDGMGDRHYGEFVRKQSR
jgi:hypothetical protein